MARSWVIVGLILSLAVAMAGCSDMESLRSYERSTNQMGDIFTFNVANGTQELLIIFSTKGSPASDGQAFLMIELDEDGADDDGDEIYFGSLGHGQRDEQRIEEPTPGRYEAIISFQGYTGPASVEIGVPTGSTTGGSGGGLGLGNNFWDILGVILALVIVTGGWFLYRRHTKRLDREMERIDETFNRLNKDVGVCRHNLLELQEELRRQLVKSKLKEAHFMILEKRIERYLETLKEKAEMGPSGGQLTPLEME